MKVFSALINAILLVALVAADNEWGSGAASAVPDRLKGIKNRDLQSGSSMKSSKSSGGSSGGFKSSKSMNVPTCTVAAPTMMVTPTIGGSGSKSKSKSKSKSGGSKSSKSQSGVPQAPTPPPQLPGNDCTDPEEFDPNLFTVVTGTIGYEGTGTEDPDAISAATCEQLKDLDPRITSCCTQTTVTPVRRLMDGERHLQQQNTSSKVTMTVNIGSALAPGIDDLLDPIRFSEALNRTAQNVSLLINASVTTAGVTDITPIFRTVTPSAMPSVLGFS